MNEVLQFSTLSELELKTVYPIEKLAHEFADSLPIFLSHHGEYYQNFKLEKKSILIGFLISQVIFDEATLFNLAIHPDFKHQGFGTFLMLNWIELMRKKKVKTFFLEVRKSNIAAIALYQKLNFQTISIRKNYYPANNDMREDALVMQLSFK